MKRSILLAAFFVLGFFAFGKTADALTLIPPSLEFPLNKGEQYKTSIKLYNGEERELTIYPEATNFGPSNDNSGVPVFDISLPKEGLSSWIEINKGPYIIKPGERIEIPFTINTPETAEPGGHFSIIFFSENPPTEGLGKSQVAISSKLGLLLFTRVEGEVEEEGAITGFSVEHSKNLTRLPINFNVSFHNSGNVHLRPYGTITIESMFGRKAATLDVNIKKLAALPNETRTFTSVWQKEEQGAPSSGFWSAFWDEYTKERENKAFGKYTATVTLNAGAENKVTDNATVVFWVFPWHIICVYAVTIIIVILALWFLMKQYNRWLTNKILERERLAQTKPEVKKNQKETEDKKE